MSVRLSQTRSVALGSLLLADAIALFAFSELAAAQNSAGKSAPTRPSTTRPVQSDYVDPGMCAGCHQEIARSYSATGMGRSFNKADATRFASEFNGAAIDNQPSGMHYAMVMHDGKLFERRSQIGFHGREANILEKQVDYVIGSGNHAHTFLHRDAQGKLVELPVSWYAEGSGYWAMSPGYDRRDQEDSRRTIPAECMFCHNAYPEPLSIFNQSTSSSPVFPKKLPTGIDCQRCHGPGRAHVNAAIAGADGDEIRRAIVNPAKLDRNRQLEVCMQCHLETSSSHEPNEIRRYNRGVLSFRPGQDLGDYKIFFDPASNQRDDRFEIAHGAYRLRMSACFRKSQMTCLTCHDPHVSYRESESADRYIAVCRGCHESVKHTADLGQTSNCIDCHMPKRRTDDAVHVVMTDHYIQRFKPDRDLLAPKPESNPTTEGASEVALYYPSKLPADAESDLYLALAKVKEKGAGAQAIEDFKKAIVQYSPKEPEFYFELAHSYFAAGDGAAAVHWYEDALHRRPVYPQAAKELAVSLLMENHQSNAEDVLKEAAAKSPGDTQLIVDLGNLYLLSGRMDDAQRTLLSALQINPSLPEAENLLGLIGIRRKHQQEAEKWLRSAIRDNPALAEAHNNLGNLLSGTSDYEQAAFEYQQAIVAKPSYAAAHHGYGLMLEMQHSYDEAVNELKRAADLDATDPEIHGDLADILAAQGQLSAAEDQYQIALKSSPNSAELHASLGGVLSAEEKPDEAMRHLERAVELAPDLYQAHLELSVLLFKTGKTAQARLHCQKAAQSPDPELRNNALSLLRQMGN
jgi:predicted CXXCH cytochrome family protein